MMTSHLKLYKSNDWPRVAREETLELNIDEAIYDCDGEQNNPDWPFGATNNVGHPP